MEQRYTPAAKVVGSSSLISVTLCNQKPIAAARFARRGVITANLQPPGATY